MNLRRCTAAAMLAVCLVGCSSSPRVAVEPAIVTATTLRAASTPPPKPPEPARVTSRKANKMGVIPILMYHRILPTDGPYDRSYANFRKDLERLYRLGYRPITLAQYIDKKIDIPPGASPVVITFDDSDPTQYATLKDGSLDPNCAIGIMKGFERQYPDFRARATFFVNPYRLFGKMEQGIPKLKQLQAWGCEIAAHTWRHSNLSKLTDAEIMADFDKTNGFLRQHGLTVRTLALPYGIFPKNRALLKDYEAVVLAGSGPARSCYDPKRRLLNLPRVWAYDGPLGINDWLTRLKSGKTKPFVQP
ncbi:MAG: polysaccharide deacetylase family protein [Chthonomonas sp.]|nr:polysaccharide deacetylase family protein [Chthonomonas sp.]